MLAYSGKGKFVIEALNLSNEMNERFSYADPVIQSYGGAGPNYRVGISYKY